MAVTVREVAEWLNGTVEGDGNVSLSAARPLTDALAGELTFLESDKYSAKWAQSLAAAAIVPEKLKLSANKPLIRVADPLPAFAEVVLRFRGKKKPRPTQRIDATARIHPTVTIGQRVTVGAYCVIGEGTTIGDGTILHPTVVVGSGCKLGEEVVLHPHVVLYEDCELGDRVVIHSGSVIGADGFGYRTTAGKHNKVPQVGGVIIGSDVEIGACTTVDRGTFLPTTIGDGTKIDNHVQIAHNCNIGKHNIFVSQVGIAGSCRTGDLVIMAGQVGIGDHVTIGDDVTIGARSAVVQDIPSHSKMLGVPAIPDREYLKILFAMQKLPDIRRDVAKMRKILGMDEAAS